MPQGPRGDVAAVEVQQVEDHEERWRRDGRGVGLAQLLEARPQLLVVDHDLAVEHEWAGGELGDCGGQISEEPRVVASVAADQADALAVLVREMRQPSTFSSYTQPWRGTVRGRAWGPSGDTV